MMRIIGAVFLALVSSHSAAAPGKGKAADDKAQNIAVTNLKAEEGATASMASLMSDILRTELYKTGHFSVMNREDMDAILREIKFQQSGACDQTACIVEMGQALGVSKMIAGSVGVFGKNYVINAKLIDIATAKNEVLVTESLLRDNADGPQPLFRVIARKLAGLETSVESPSQPSSQPSRGFTGRRYLFGVQGVYRQGKLGGEKTPTDGSVTPLDVGASGLGFGFQFEYRFAEHLSLAVQGSFTSLDSDPDKVSGTSGTARVGEGSIMGRWSPLKKFIRPYLAAGAAFGGLDSEGIPGLPGTAGTYFNPQLGLGMTFESKGGLAFWISGSVDPANDGSDKVNLGTLSIGVGLAR